MSLAGGRPRSDQKKKNVCTSHTRGVVAASALSPSPSASPFPSRSHYSHTLQHVCAPMCARVCVQLVDVAKKKGDENIFWTLQLCSLGQRRCQRRLRCAASTSTSTQQFGFGFFSFFFFCWRSCHAVLSRSPAPAPLVAHACPATKLSCSNSSSSNNNANNNNSSSNNNMPEIIIAEDLRATG